MSSWRKAAAIGPARKASVAAAVAALGMLQAGCGGRATAASAAHSLRPRPVVIVSLTFDDGDASQYTLAFQRGLRPHGMHGTFYIVTGATSTHPESMTWPELAALYRAGNDVGGHTVDHIDLASAAYSRRRKTAEICGNYRALAAHRLHPVTFAYPYGAYDAAAEGIVARCGFRTARAAGGIDHNGVGAGPVFAESVPPRDPYAVMTPEDLTGAAPQTLFHLEREVIAAARHGGGWLPLVFHEICSPISDPASYGYCTHSWASIQLDTFNAFLDWLGHAGQPGGAPAGTVVRTVRQVIGRS